ncbi:MAG: type 4a pilus biogenesis protein PilO [Phycisphaerae bacterium]|nr:type 4a pilus biogenesis protein PilO [Phycisphaerae bacterium]
MNASGSRLSHRKQQVWVYVIAGLFVCDFALCGYIPSQQRLASLRRTQAGQKQTIQMAAAQSAELPGLERRLRGMEKAVTGFDLRVPADRALGTFLQQISGIMTDCRLTEQVVLPGKEVKTDDLNCVPLHVACKGILTDFFGFFRKVQSLDRLVRIEKVVMENDSDLTGRISLQVEAVIFEQSAKYRKTNGPAEAPSAGGVNRGA